MTRRIAKELVEIAIEANEIVATFDEHVRGAAFRFLVERVAETPTSPRNVDELESVVSEDSSDGAADFFNGRESGTPADNAVSLAAFLYSKYGGEPFTLDEIRELARTVGLIVPARIDMTFLAAKREGRSLFRRQGPGKFAPTVHGELHFQQAFTITRGKSRRPTMNHQD